MQVWWGVEQGGTKGINMYFCKWRSVLAVCCTYVVIVALSATGGDRCDTQLQGQ